MSNEGVAILLALYRHRHLERAKEMSEEEAEELVKYFCGQERRGGMMGLLHLSPDEQKRVRWVMDWIHRMAQRYGGTVREKETLRTWDWGQALCRECYGPDWNNVISEQGIETPSWEDIERAQRWEDGELPEWFANKEEEEEDAKGREDSPRTKDVKAGE